jgi:hypothetical protein
MIAQVEVGAFSRERPATDFDLPRRVLPARPLLRRVWKLRWNWHELRMKLPLLILVIVCASRAAIAADMIPSEMYAYVSQSICIDGFGNPTARLPIEDGCDHLRLQRSNDVAAYRKHDWPNAVNTPEVATGYQASDSVMQRRGRHTLIIQTFDFGTGNRRFGQFDDHLGDGGQVLLLVGQWMTAAMTEDGTGSVQWFLGKECRSPSPRENRFKSWLMFGRDTTDTRWRSIVAYLNISSDQRTCPRRFNSAYTRYRRGLVEFPFRLIDVDKKLTSVRRVLKVIVSEHYGGDAITSADHLERFFFAKSLGLVRWERWANGNFSQFSAVHDAAHILAQTDRCPSVSGYGSPGSKWFLADCRTWTTLIRQTSGWTVDDYKWKALAEFDAVR